MRTLVLVLGLLIVACGASMGDSVTVDTYAGWNLVAAPLVPINPAPESVYSQFDLMFTTALLRFDGPTQSQIPYDPWATPPTVFGNVLLGDGYWVGDPDAHKIIYDGVPDGVPDGSGNKTDMWISLPGEQADGQDNGGWHLIGQPFNHDTAIDFGNLNGENIKFTDGTTMKTWDEAVQANWVADSALFFDGVSQSQKSTGYFFNEDDHFRAGHGYWVQTKKDNLAMIIPAQPS